MKSQNTQIAKFLQYVAFVYRVENAIFVKKQNSIVRNAQNNGFVMHISFEMGGVNIYQKRIILNVKRSVSKNLIWSIKNIFLNAVQGVNYYKIICYIILIL